MGASAPAPVPLAGPLPELAGVYWRPRIDERSLARSARLWTLTTLAHTVPFTAAAMFLALLAPVTIPVALILLAHAWIIPELYAARGANVVRRRAGSGRPQEHRAMLLLGDLISPAAQRLYERTGLVMERGRFGVWLLGEAGALLVRSGSRRVYCYCVKATDPDLPAADKTAHLLLALRADEAGFATVANLAFSGALWRLRRRLAEPAREAVAEARAAAAADPQTREGEDIPRPQGASS